MSKPAPLVGLRRTPTQARSVERVQRMLDTFEELVGELGYEPVSTTLVAERAQVSVGSLYQFFPDKRALAHALASRYLERFLTEIGEVFTTGSFTGWLDAVDPLVDRFVRMQREIPAFRFVRFGDPIDIHLLNEASDNNAVVAARMESALRPFVTGSDEVLQQLPLALGLSLEAADAVLKFSFRMNPDGDPALVAIAKDVVRTVLSKFELPLVRSTHG